ncbi:S1 family peptidase [Sphaerisporangium corydalis]|uniref:S1 family peptidase n=1 Tax=Sphaerisporangium corydalis TaxID=1441875 RepID=A0ABV9EHM9_9ACTN|nr:S1 family peptidase [Sphaerisporangium corydalis]
MSRRRRAVTWRAVVVGVLVLAAAPGTAQARPVRAAATAEARKPPPGMIEALQRDLGLSPAQAQARLLNESRLAPLAERFHRTLGGDFAGAWLSGTIAQTLVVATTKAADIPRILTAGARPEVVIRSLKQLNTIKGKLDSALPPHPVAGGSVRYIDVRNNVVTVLSEDPSVTETAIKSTGVDSSAVKVVVSTERPVPLYDLVGGDPYYIGATTRCSIGFSVMRGTQNGFVSAGHCGVKGQATFGVNRVAQGVIQASVFPISDFSYIGVNRDWTPTPSVNNGIGSVVGVEGSEVAIEGASVCRAGSTDDWHCGTIRQRNVSVAYPQGNVFHLTRTSVCAERGDSGGPFVSIDQAQGVTSGGSGDCVTGGTSYFQPVAELLTSFGLTLVTTHGAHPPPTTAACSGYPRVVTGTLAPDASAYQPGDRFYRSAVSGVHAACLQGPPGADFDLYLQKWGGREWVTVASAESPGSGETITYTGTAGRYRYQVKAAGGSGPYSLGYATPGPSEPGPLRRHPDNDQ